MEKCRKLLAPEQFQVFFDDEDDFKKKRSDNTVFRHDHLRCWDTVQNQKGLSVPISPSHNRSITPNRRYDDQGYYCSDSIMFSDKHTQKKEGGTITPYKAKKNEFSHRPNNNLFENTVVLTRDQTNNYVRMAAEHTVSKPPGVRKANVGRGRALPSYMLHTKSSIKKFSLK